MKEHPLIYSTEMVRAYLEDRKSMSRRVVTPHTSIVGEGKVDWSKFCWDGSQVYRDTCIHGHTELCHAPLPFKDGDSKQYHEYLHVPYNWEEDMTIFRCYAKWEIGDRLWVKESFYWNPDYMGYGLLKLPPKTCTMKYPVIIPKERLMRNKAPVPDLVKRHYKYYSSIFMPRWASRLTQTITEIRVERLKDISEEDARREGFVAVSMFHEYWDKLNSKRGYGFKDNPWLWAICYPKYSEEPSRRLQ